MIGKNMKKIIFFLISAVVLLFSTDISSAGAWIHPDFTEYTPEFTTDAPSDDSYLAKKLTITEDFILPEGKELYIRDGGTLVIQNGASFTADGWLTIERGGRLIVKKGTLTVTDLLKNLGTVDIRKNGSLTLCRGGSYHSNAGSRLIQKGEIVFGDLRLSDLTERILKYDKNFSLDTYCVYTYNCGDNMSDWASNHDVILNYCIGDIETDYYYKAKNSTAHPKLTRRGYSLERVYSTKRAERIKRAAEKYADESQLYRYYDDPTYFEIDIGFAYSYKTRLLEVHMSGFQAGFDPDDGEEDDFIFMADVIEETVGRV